MKTIKETYKQITERHNAEINGLESLFFAFSREQFAKGMAKIGLDHEQDVNKVAKVGLCGIMLKSEVPKLKALLEQHELEQYLFFKDDESLLEALVYELNNYEFCYTDDYQVALEALGLKESDINPEILAKAINLTYKEDNEDDE